jgi:predicted RNA binding protein YcfA (HicA-like mRNA interferase family)
MKLPRDVEGPRLVKALAVLGYEASRHRGPHIRVTTQRDGENHEGFPYQAPIKAGTLSSILKHIAAHHRVTVEQVLEMLEL